MPRYIAFLRAINVGGHVVKMDVLKAQFEGLGLTRVETFIASGNVIFESRPLDRPKLEAKIEGALMRALGYEVATFVRSIPEVHAIARYQAFAPSRVAAAAALNVGLLKAPLDEPTRQALQKLRTDVDDFHTNDKQLYWICLMRQSESKVSNALFERALKVKATFRGIKTITRLAAKYPL